MSQHDKTQILQGVEIGILAALVSQSDQSTKSLAGYVESGIGEVESALKKLESQNRVQCQDQKWSVTIAGLETFYKTLSNIQDVLAPRTRTRSLPFTVETVWEHCLCFNYLVDVQTLTPLVPDIFEIVTVDERAVVSVTAASLSSMRPTGLPDLVGQNFCHITFRVIVQFVNVAGEHRCGYLFIESMSNSPVLTRISNSVTEFKFHEMKHSSISFLKQDNHLVLGAEIPGTDFRIVTTIDDSQTASNPPDTSIFNTRQDMDEQVLDYNDAFGYIPGQRGVYVLSVERGPWHYRFVEPVAHYMSYFQEGAPFSDETAQLDSVLYCTDIPYRWKPLEYEIISPQ